LSPKPLRALALGLLIGLILAAVVVVVLLRHRIFARQSPHWD
jgi:hypothetical protein